MVSKAPPCSAAASAATAVSSTVRQGNVDTAKELFYKLPVKGLVPTVVTYSTIIHGLCKEGKLEKANDLFVEMEEKGCAPNVVTFNTLLSGFCQNNEPLKVVEFLPAEAARMALFWASEVNQEYVIVEADYQVLVNCSFSASITSVEGTRRRIRLCRPSYDIGGICDDACDLGLAPLRSRTSPKYITKGKKVRVTYLDPERERRERQRLRRSDSPTTLDQFNRRSTAIRCGEFPCTPLCSSSTSLLDDNTMAEENFEEHDMSGELENENSNPPEVQAPENGSGGVEVQKWPGWPGENVFRMLIPVQKVGGIIGRKGEFIKKMCEETKARIKILDGPPGSIERTVLVSAKEEPDLPISPAMEGLLRVHKRIVDVDSDPANAPSGAGGMVCTRLLVAANQAGVLIGKQGATIKSIQDASSCTIRILGGENLPPFALPDDSIVEVQGEATGVHKAVELIATNLRKFLVDRSVIPVFEMQMQVPNAEANQNIPPHQPWGSAPQGFGGGPGFMPNPQYMPPPRQFDNYYPPQDMPHDKQLRQGPPAYGRDASMGVHATSAPSQQSVVTKVTQSMQIPLLYADAVIGISGANISYIRRASGASIAIQETRGVPGEMTNSMAEAASNAQNNPAAPTGQPYDYPSQGPVYGSPPSNLGGGHAPADYAYGTNYGY
ncbi:hypothetical protein RHGRI_035819 [Rhododendron griersonianum]|uniref:K Homology domain-containing protein n=1 Tax=Rhododendron griersonianum TaxID=479676 RepID=A0AAV6HL27_9ERIC|nr:hypothetical protein RHGRI_035819 [Rhododendron griersonianum]